MAKRRCSVDGCESPHEARGWCNKHYQRWRNHGDPFGSAHPPEDERFWSKVAKSEGCWLWTAGTTMQGYGKFRVGSMKDGSRRIVSAHRYSYELAKGQIPDGLHIDHLCRTPLCVKPAHLEAVLPVVNVRRGEGFHSRNLAKTECVNGHPLSGSNLYVYWDRKGVRHRHCIICRRDAKRRQARRQKMVGVPA